MSKVVKAVVGVALVVAGVLTGNFQLIIAGVSLVGGALFSPKGGKPRGAAVTTLQVGEVPRQGIVGRAATAGSLVDAFNYGGKYGTDWEVLVIALADHRCDALEGFYVNDTYVNFAGDGMVGGYNNQLSIWWRPGTESQTVPTVLTANGPGWTANDNGAGVSYAVVAYKADASDAKNPVWTNGRPRFLFVVRGALCYDPRKDSTASGVGAHRWLNPATWEWSQNTIVTRYKFARGFYACDRVTQPDQLLLGRGLSDVEAPTANLFHRANLCDEVVDGEPRYQVGGLFESTETYLDVENDFAAACAGTIVQPEGAVEIDPGEARAAVVTITDQDLVVGSKVKRRWFLGIADREWVNSVVANYIEPSQKWTQHAAPVRRDNADILADKGPREESLQLGFVSWAKQAGRVAEIVRRLGRLHIRAEIVLPPRFCELEEGDWIVWQSDRYLKGNAYTFRIEAWGSDRSWQHSVVLRQISASCYSDTALLTDGSVAVLQPPRDPIGAPSAANWALTAGHLDAGSIRTPALVVTGASNDPSARFIRMEYVQGAAAPNEATVWSDAGVTGPDIKRREIPVAAGGTYRVGISYIVDGTQGDRLILGPVIALAVTYPNGVPVENLQPVEPGATNDANLDDPTQLIINEKIRLIESEPKRINRKAQVRARMVALGLSITAIDAAELNWLAYRNALAPAWDSTASHSVVNRSTWNTLSQAFDAAIDLGDKAISEEDAKRAEWSTTYNRPVLLTGQGVTVDENLLDPTVWAQGSGTFSNAGNGDGWYSSSGVYASIYHSAVTATPIDPTASYEVSMDVIQDIAGQGTATFYCGVVLYDANGNNITGDGTFWHYFKANETTYFGSEWETTSARIGRGTAKPFPTNAVKFGLVCLLNYNNTATTCRVRRMRTKRITKSEMTAAMPHLWQLADGIAVRTAGNNAENWGHVAYENTFTAGPQKLTFKGHRPGTGGSGAACIIGLTDQAAITNYNDLDAAFYLDDVGAFYIYENGTLRYTGSAYPANTEYGIEYDGLRFRYYVAGDLIAYSSIPGPDKSFKLALDTYYRDTGAVGITHTSTKSTAIVGSNITDTTGNFLGEADLRNNQIGIVSGNFINPVGAGNNYEVGNELLDLAFVDDGTNGRTRLRLRRNNGNTINSNVQLPAAVQNVDQRFDQVVPGYGKPENNATVGAVAGTNLTDINGNPINVDHVRNNMALIDWWKRGATIPWNQNAEFNTIYSSSSVDLGNNPPPIAGQEDFWFCQEITGDGNNGGGWDSAPIAKLDPDKTYRFVVPVYNRTGDGSVYWGTGGVADLNTTAYNANPYFAVANIPTGRWYLMVGYIYPRNSGGHNHDNAGTWDCVTGLKYTTGLNFNFLPDGTQPIHRAYQFYASNGSQKVFARPLINLVDGTEPDLRMYFGDSATLNNQIGVDAGVFKNPVGPGHNYEVGNEKLRVAVDTGGVGGRARARLFRADGGALVNEAQLPDIVQNIDQQWNQVSGAGRPEDYATVGAAWGSNLTGRPTELTDGRIPTGLDASGYNQVGIRNPNHALVSNTDLLGGISGTQLHENPELHGGAQNGFYGYDNSGGGKTLLSVVADNTAPNGSGYTLNITYDGTGTESVNPTPGWGGFTAALSDDGGVRRQGFYSRGTTLVHKLWVLIPAGRTIAFASNATGNEAIHEFLTPTNGTGSWQLIIFRQRIGITGTFGSTGVFFVYGGANTAFTWRVAKHEIYDITSPQRQFLGRGGLIDQNGNPLFNGNVRNEDLRVVEDAGGTGGRARLRLQYNGGGADAHIIQPSAALQNVDQRFDQVVPGYGKPEDYSTKGSNRVFNGDAATHTLAGWSKTYYQSNTFEISAQGEAIGGERSFALRKPASGVGGAVAVCKAIQVIPGQKLYARIKYYGSTTTANGIYFRIAEYNARPEPTYVDYLDFGGAVGGSVAGSSNTDMINNGPVSGAGVTAFEGPYTVPAGVYWVSVMVLNWTVGPATLIFDDVYLGESQSGADVTTLVTGGRSIKVAYDHTGAVKSGQLPIDVLIKMYDGNANVTTSTAWSASLLSGTATFTIGAATGVLNITALSTDATIDVVGVYGGKTRRSEVSLIRNIDIPPTGGYSASANVNGTVTTSYGSSSTGVMQVRTGANGSVSCSGVIDFVKTVVGTTGAYGKWQWRAVGGSFADIATEQASSVNAVRTGGSEPTSDPGSLSVGMTKGSLSANTIYEFQLLVRGASSSIEAGGAASLVGS